MTFRALKTASLTSAIPIAAIALSALLGTSCVSGEESAPPVAEDLTSKYYDVLLGDRPVLGLVTGGIYVAGDQPLSTHGDAFFSELGRLGARWIRMEANWQDTPPEVYRSIVQKAHEHNISVVVVVPHTIVKTVPDPRPNSAGLPELYCAKDDNTQDIDFFTTAYVSALDKLASETFSGALPDAWEITNEANDEGCGTDQRRVGGNALAWLLQRVWKWKTEKNRYELIISGGVLGTYYDSPTEVWWKSYLSSGAWAAGPRPFDYFGIHPYDQHTYSRDCIESRAPGCAGSITEWAEGVRGRLKGLRTKLDSITKSSGTKLFVTEFGWQTKPGCGLKDNCFNSSALTAAGMGATMEAMRGLVDVALWYDYRDDPGQSFGLRGPWDGGRYPAKRDLWNLFATLGGGPGGNPDAPWSASPPPKTPPRACEVDPEIVIDCGPAVGRPADEDHSNDHCAYFKATSLTVAGKLYRFWKDNGGLAVFGYPISPPSCIPNPDANGKGQLFAQWFERQRMEYHPENAGTKYEVLLGRLGAERAEGAQGSSLDAPESSFGKVGGASDGSCVFFAETGHQICGELARYYFFDGSRAPAITPRSGAPQSKLSPLDLLGFPVTEAFGTTCDGQPCTVQYTERARLEIHPNEPEDKYRVLQGLLGNEIWRP